MATSIGQNPTSPANGSPPPIPPANPTSSLKRPHSELTTTSDTDLAPSSKRQKTAEWVVLDENCGEFRLIPDEVVYRILSHFNASTLLTVGITCKRFLYLADRAPMWQELCLNAKLSLEKVDSFRLAFLSAITKESPDAYLSKADFFSMGIHTKQNQNRALNCYMRALACLDHAINMDPVWENGIFSERQIETVFKKEALFLTNKEFDRSWFAPGQIQTTYDQLDHITATCPRLDQAARASLLHTVMRINDRHFQTLPILSIWNEFNTIRLDEQVSDQVRKTAKYMLSLFTVIKSTDRWEPRDFEEFKQSQRDLSDAERAKILKECIADRTALPWCSELAKWALVLMRLRNLTEEITDKEAYEMLESLKNAPYLFSNIDPELIEERMQAFRDQKRV